jgi:hypothetical protein
LRSGLELCLFAQQSFDYVLALHVHVAREHAVDAQAEVLRLDLLRLDLSNVLMGCRPEFLKLQ